MYVIFPFTEFTQGSCTVLTIPVHALWLLALRFHPLAVYNAAEVAIQEKPQMFLPLLFGWGWCKTAGAEIQAGKIGEN